MTLRLGIDAEWRENRRLHHVQGQGGQKDQRIVGQVSLAGRGGRHGMPPARSL